MARHLSALAALVCICALAGGCSAAAAGLPKTPGGGARSGTMTSPQEAAASSSRSGPPASAGFNNHDVQYAQQMAAEDEQVLAMAKLPQIKSSGGVVPTLADAALEELPSHIALYRQWLASWKEPVPGALGTGSLPTVNGTRFEAAFLALFLANQKAVLTAATQEASSGRFGPARQDAANAVAVTTQTIGSIRPG